MRPQRRFKSGSAAYQVRVIMATVATAVHALCVTLGACTDPDPISGPLPLHAFVLRNHMAQQLQSSASWVCLRPQAPLCYCDAGSDHLAIAGIAHGRRVNLNLAGEEELATLPGVGPALAERIARARDIEPFLLVEDLMNVEGIGPVRLQRLRPLVTVQR